MQHAVFSTGDQSAKYWLHSIRQIHGLGLLENLSWFNPFQLERGDESYLFILKQGLSLTCELAKVRSEKEKRDEFKRS